MKGREQNVNIWKSAYGINDGKAFAVRLVHHEDNNSYIPEISLNVEGNDIVWSGTPLDYVMEQPTFNEYVDFYGEEEVHPISASMLLERYTPPTRINTRNDIENFKKYIVCRLSGDESFSIVKRDVLNRLTDEQLRALEIAYQSNSFYNAAKHSPDI